MFKKYKKIHFVGVGGIGISALAKWAILEGIKVSGSDSHKSDVTDELKEMGVKIKIGHDKKNVPVATDLIIYSFAVPEDNSERKNKIKQLSYFEALGELTKSKKVIAVSGTNGKSTTTAMLGKILIDAGLDPTVIVGSKIKDFKYGNFNLGSGKLFVIEACEHNAHMLLLHPDTIVLTNIEADHLDFYKNLGNILKTFKKYIKKLPKGGTLIYNKDDKNSQAICATLDVAHGVDYGLKGANLMFIERHVKNGKQTFAVTKKDEELGKIELTVPGLYNVYNAMATILSALELGVEFSKIKKSLASFDGLWRRFEYVGDFGGARIISDYGHHPTAIVGAILATREFFPNNRIVVAFEPHQHHRTKALFADFVRSFDDADILILSEIYNVEGRVEAKDEGISGKMLAEEIEKYWESGELDIKDKKIFYSADLEETEAILRKEIKKKDIVLVMGAGDIDIVARNLCA